MIYYTNPNTRIIAWNSSYPPEWLIKLINGERQKGNETVVLLTEGENLWD